MTQGQPPKVDSTILLPLACAATACPTLQIDTWQTTCLSIQGRRSIFRFAGKGHDGVTSRPWSLILKTIQSPVDTNAPDTDLHSWIYWEREYLLPKS